VELGFDGRGDREGAKRGALTGPNPTDRAKRGCKRHVAVDGRGVPIGVTISAANLHDSRAALPTLDSVKQYAPSHRKRPEHCCLDKGYDSADIERGLKKRGIQPHIRHRGEESRPCRRGKPRRWKVERTNSWHNRYRALLIRWDVKPAHYRALVLLASALIAFRVALW
jgi:transposase